MLRRNWPPSRVVAADALDRKYLQKAFDSCNQRALLQPHVYTTYFLMNLKKK